MSVQLVAFATGVLPNICEFHLYTGSSTNLYRIPDRQSKKQFQG
jgi:hypothetical protein